MKTRQRQLQLIAEICRLPDPDLLLLVEDTPWFKPDRDLSLDEEILKAIIADVKRREHNSLRPRIEFLAECHIGWYKRSSADGDTVT